MPRDGFSADLPSAVLGATDCPRVELARRERRLRRADRDRAPSVRGAVKAIGAPVSGAPLELGPGRAARRATVRAALSGAPYRAPYPLQMTRLQPGRFEVELSTARSPAVEPPGAVPTRDRLLVMGLLAVGLLCI